MRYIIFAVGLFILASATPAAAQDMLWLRPGAKVRVTAPALGMSEQVGRVQETRGDTLLLETDVMRGGHLRSDTVHVAASKVTKLDVRTGSRSHWLEGAGIGFLVGAAIGLASGDDQSGFFEYSAGEKATMYGGLLGIVGALIGATHKSDKWAEVPLDRLRPRLVAQQDGVGIGVALRF